MSHFEGLGKLFNISLGYPHFAESLCKTDGNVAQVMLLPLLFLESLYTERTFSTKSDYM